MTKNIERRRSSKNERSSRGYITRSVDPMAEGGGTEGERLTEERRKSVDENNLWI